MSEYLPAIKQLKTDLANSPKAELLAQISSRDVIVVAGTFDKVEDILTEMEIEHTMFNYGISETAHLYPNQIVLVNCPGYNIHAPTIANFVSSGGWLVTADWALGRVIEQAFPRTIQQLGRTQDDVIKITPCNSKITKGVLENSQFWLEASSHVIGITDTDAVKILIKSDEMKRKYNSEIVMVGFNWGKGKVFHSISHFILQKSKSGKTRMEDAYSSLVLLTNILAQKKAASENGLVNQVTNVIKTGGDNNVSKNTV